MGALLALLEHCWEHCWGSQALRLCCSCISAYDGLRHDLIELCGNERAGARRRSIVLGTVAARTVVIDLGVRRGAIDSRALLWDCVFGRRCLDSHLCLGYDAFC